MLVVYEADSGRIVGHCGTVYDNGTWREATVDELYPRRDRSNLASVQVPDSPRFMLLGKEHYQLKRDPQGAVTGIEPVPALRLTCDVQDDDGDGLPDLPADGRATTRVSVTGLDPGVEATFRTTRGTLARRTATADDDGTATVELRSGTETVAVAVTASAPGYRPATLALEFIPVADAEAAAFPAAFPPVEAPTLGEATRPLPVASARPPWRVRVTAGSGEGQAFDLHPGVLTIGREASSEIHLQEDRVSNNHALLRVSGESVTIEDLRSTNGTKVNGVAIDRATKLAAGDKIEIGGVDLTVEQNEGG